MEPKIEATAFGSITIRGEKFNDDVIIRLNGTVERRKKELSKSVYGTSHRIALAEAQYIFEEGVTLLIIGAGQHGLVRLDAEARKFLDERGCRIRLLPTPEAIRAWNEAKGKVIALFHVTC